MNKIYCTAVLAALLVLAACGEPSNNSSASPDDSAASTRPSGTVVLDVKTEDGKTPTLVGHVVAGKGLESTGASGQLMFGPYAAMAAGNYKVTVYGEFEGSQPAAPLVVDVGYGQGATVAKSVDVKVADASNGILTSFDFTLPNKVADIEVRARVADGTHVTIKGYRVTVK